MHTHTHTLHILPLDPQRILCSLLTELPACPICDAVNVQRVTISEMSVLAPRIPTPSVSKSMRFERAIVTSERSDKVVLAAWSEIHVVTLEAGRLFAEHTKQDSAYFTVKLLKAASMRLHSVDNICLLI